MDKRSWPWKKKSSDKGNADKLISTSESAGAPTASPGTQGDQPQGKQDKKPKYVQISVESYTHLTGLEDQVKLYEDELKTYADQLSSYKDQVQDLENVVTELNDKLSEADSEIVTKENLVKQHSKVAEDAVSGWEKAEAEALALKDQLESVTLLKLTAEDRASHLDGALKECMRQIRNLKEEHEQKLHEVVSNKTKQCDMIKAQLETQISNLEQELFRSASDNAAISRSLQERSSMLIKISEEKSQAEADIEQLKSNVDSCEREINSLKYELHIVAKELEIRNEEKNMSVRSAEVANKQHLEGAKKIAKLEAECQRLRGLVRKKLPGPAAMAQMKLEVENLGRDYGETRARRSPVKPPISPHMSQLSEFSHDSAQKQYKDSELLTEQLLEMEEETKMLKEALAKRNSELQASRSVCAKTMSKLQSLEAQLQTNNQHKIITKSSPQIRAEGSLGQNSSSPPSLTSLSEDGNDDQISCAGSWTTGLISEHSVKKEKNTDSPVKAGKANQLELMDDFLEMEKLACSTNESNGADSNMCITHSTQSEVPVHDLGVAITSTDSDLQEKKQFESSETLEISEKEDQLPYKELQSRISMVFRSLSQETDLERVLEEITNVVQSLHNDLHHNSVKPYIDEPHCSSAADDQGACPENAEVSTDMEVSVAQDSKHELKEDVRIAVTDIHEFVMLLGKEAKVIQDSPPDEDGLSRKLEELSFAFNDVLNSEVSVIDYVLCLSEVFRKANKLRFSVLGYNDIDTENSSSDCIDKIALPENKTIQKSGEKYDNSCAHFSDSIDSTSNPDIPHEGTFVPTSECKSLSWNCSSEEFEQLKLEKDHLVVDLARCTEILENTKSQLVETEQLLAEAKSQLVSAQKMNSLAETQLKCMVESYKSLESRAQESQVELNLLRGNVESLQNELQEERSRHQDALMRCKSLQEELLRIENDSGVDADVKSKQEIELAAATEKLAECQETIFLLGKQLRLMRPQPEYPGSPSTDRSQKKVESFTEVETTTSTMNLHSVDMSEKDTAISTDSQHAGGESPMNLYDTLFSTSDSEVNNLLRSPIDSKHPNNRFTKSGSTSSSTATPEKNSRGFSRFFSSKSKNDH
ncbi:filament-like plant protein 4 isoform X1 [Daucus carota subsp. sativus]|uniref:filament-like plant protein 4 isoform X1 n=1 Tax=Daucus carota subsp. sativus TaxID=79200 RepID=UPI0007F03E70|nr:PREDICTED: filament-like plant protein 4 isoform X1 [Daucus carota subsp. sativus]XP_017242664.1 PREDICTED: filament-like plant protein 4 isoform X1 [Daucus carota subsp. sativus]XP_017242665.1 PREDICTED: filament-like plant protein 4 isoform X1 [Daucus carota subsp. sativus]